MRMQRYLKRIFWELKTLPSILVYQFTNKKRAIYVGCTGMNNLGDEVIFLGKKTSHCFHLCFKFSLWIRINWSRERYPRNASDPVLT